MRLAGKTVLVTGGASGIGQATVLRLAGEGAAVAVVDVNEAEGRSVVARIEGPAPGSFHRCDVTREEEVAAAVSAVRERHGGLHVLITAAGILQGAYQHVETLEPATFARVLDVNLLGTFLACKYAAPLIEASGGGVILCISSGGGVQGPSSSLAYGASKAAVQGFCRTLEAQMAPRGIRVNVVCPGSLDTPMKRQNIIDGAVAHGRDPVETLASTTLGDPDGLAKILTFLATDDAEYLRGTVFTR